MIDHEIRIAAPAATVFALLTEADRLLEWIAVEATADARPGGLLRWTHVNGDVMSGRFVELDPPHRLVFAYGWEKPAERGIAPGSTLVEITLVESGGETHLRLVHLGLPAAAEASHRFGWAHFLPRMAAATTGRPPA